MTLRFASDKLALLLALVPYLDEVRVVSVDEAAEHFKVTARDIRAAVNLIAMSGVPTVGQIAMPNDMFEIDWDSFLDDDVIVLVQSVVLDETLRFSARETSALIAGLQYLAALPGAADNELLLGLLTKLAQAGSGSAFIATADASEQAVPAELSEAISSGTQVEFTYANPDGRSEQRTVDPVAVQSESGQWYLRGWCHDRQALRVFRFDRMSQLHATDRPIDFAPADLTVPETLFNEGSQDFDVELEVARAAIPLLGEYARGVSTPKSGDPVTITVRVAHLHGLKRVVSAHPELMRVVSPASAVTIVADWAGTALSQYSDATSVLPVD